MENLRVEYSVAGENSENKKFSIDAEVSLNYFLNLLFFHGNFAENENQIFNLILQKIKLEILKDFGKIIDFKISIKIFGNFLKKREFWLQKNRKKN